MNTAEAIAQTEWEVKSRPIAKIVTFREFNIPLPSQYIAVIKVPYPMTDEDHTFFCEVIKEFKPGLVHENP